MNEEEICCPKFDPAPWDDKIIEWESKRFIKDHVYTIFYIPLNFGGVMTRLTRLVEKAGATFPDALCLSEHASQWNMDLYLAVDREIPGAENVTMNGTYLTKVYEGEFKDTGKWRKEFATFAEGKGKKIEKEYMWYTTCPKCAKKYGKNYVVIIAKVA